MDGVGEDVNAYGIRPASERPWFTTTTFSLLSTTSRLLG